MWFRILLFSLPFPLGKRLKICNLISGGPVVVPDEMQRAILGTRVSQYAIIERGWDRFTLYHNARPEPKYDEHSVSDPPRRLEPLYMISISAN